ncbi:MAG: methyltransferase domain-containing protein [Deltaproteobacteria bacterium]|nr:methyltransferase domain-containing protein [Deltaproteobacteria bacterium]
MFLYEMYKTGLTTFWYWYVGKLTAIWPNIKINGHTFRVYPGVYKPLENEHTAVQFCKKEDRVLDLGCGSGITTAFAAKVAKEVVAVDISERAIKNARENCAVLNCKNVEFKKSDMFSNVDGKFNVILSNPPYLSTDLKGDDRQFVTSVKYLPTLFSKVSEHLEDNGTLLVQFPGWFKSKLVKLANSHGLEVVSIKPMPAKSLYLSLLSLAYMQVGFRSTLFVMKKKKSAVGNDSKKVD